MHNELIHSTADVLSGIHDSFYKNIRLLSHQATQCLDQEPKKGPAGTLSVGMLKQIHKQNYISLFISFIVQFVQSGNVGYLSVLNVVFMSLRSLDPKYTEEGG